MPTINDREWWLKKALQADENARWNTDRANKALREGNMAAYKSHLYDANSYKKEAENCRYNAKKCSK